MLRGYLSIWQGLSRETDGWRWMWEVEMKHPQTFSILCSKKGCSSKVGAKRAAIMAMKKLNFQLDFQIEED